MCYTNSIRNCDKKMLRVIMLRIYEIFTEILLPIFLMIIAGYGIQKKFNLQLGPLIKVQLYLFIPALIFYKIATSNLEGSMVILISGFTVALFFILMAISWFLARIFNLDKKKEKAFVNAITLRNQGNFGIPLMTLLYAGMGDNYGLSIHMIVLFTTNLLLNTFGLYNASSGSYTRKEAAIKVLRLPMIYVVIAGFVFKGFRLSIPGPFESTLSILGNAVVPLALFTLGAQLANTKFKLTDKSLPIAVMMRLVISPILAWLLVLIVGIQGITAEVLIIGAAAPTAVNSVLFAMEFNGDAEYASETVMVTTLLSALTVTLTILLVKG